MRYRGWRTGLDSMRAAKLTKTWRQRVRRLGRRKMETILRLGESQDHMVVVTDRLHDLDWLPRANRPAPYWWWAGRDSWVRRAPDERWKTPRREINIELNATDESTFLLRSIGSEIRFQHAYHDGRGWCMSDDGTATVVSIDHVVRLRQEVFVRASLRLAVDRAEVEEPMSYADFLQLDTSSFISGWKRWLIEWIRHPEVSVFGDR